MSADLRTALRALLFLLVFPVAGPPLGYAAFLAMALIQEFIAALFTARLPTCCVNWSWRGLASLWLGFWAFLPFAYLAGGVQAALTGGVAAIWAMSPGRLPLRPVLWASGVTGLGFCAVSLIATQLGGKSVSASGLGFPVLAFLFIHVAAGTGAWLLCRMLERIFRLSERPTEPR